MGIEKAVGMQRFGLNQRPYSAALRLLKGITLSQVWLPHHLAIPALFRGAR